MAKIERILELLRTRLEAEQKAEQKFGRVTTDKGIIEWPGEEDLKEGDSVEVVTEDETREAAADGDYKTEDGKTIVVVDGKVAEIRDPEAEVAPEGEEAAEVEPEAEPDYKALYEEALAKIAELEAALEEVRNAGVEATQQAQAEAESLSAEVESLRAQVTELKAQPAAKPAHEEVKETSFRKTGAKGLDRVAELMSK